MLWCETCSWWSIWAILISFLGLSWPNLGTLSGNFSQNWCCLLSKHHISWCWTIPCHIWGRVQLVALWCETYLIFGFDLAKPWQAACQQFSTKTDAVCCHSTISVDAEPYHVIHMGLMSDVVMWNMLLVAILCHVDHLLGFRLLAKAWQAVSILQPKLMLFVVMAPCLNVYKPQNTVLKILPFHSTHLLGKLRYSNTVDLYK